MKCDIIKELELDKLHKHSLKEKQPFCDGRDGGGGVILARPSLKVKGSACTDDTVAVSSSVEVGSAVIGMFYVLSDGRAHGDMEPLIRSDLF